MAKGKGYQLRHNKPLRWAERRVPLRERVLG